MTYEEVVKSILEIPKFTRKNEPSHTKEFMRRLGNPQDSFGVIHVAGSNGKGSVCAFLNSILQESGVSTGLFTSPHLVDMRERFRISGELCSQEQFLKAEGKVRDIVKNMQEEGMAHPTFFEYIFAVGMVLFQQARVDCVVLETGLGGRLDATNVVEHPLLTVITSISLEHTEILGDTIEDIAAEKAGIIKAGVPVVFDGSEPKAEPVIMQKAKELHTEAEKVSWNSIKILLNDGKNIDFSIESEYDVTRVSIPFPAEYQVLNATLAFTAARKLQHVFPITKETMLRGLQNVSWQGRMEAVEPEVYLDGAHNVSGVEAFLNAVDRMAQQPSVLLFSMVKEKNYREAIRLICESGSFSEIVLTQISENPRALAAEELEQCFREEWNKCTITQGETWCREKPEDNKLKIVVIEEPEQAYMQAKRDKCQGQLLFCAGSLYLIGEIKKITGGQTND